MINCRFQEAQSVKEFLDKYGFHLPPAFYEVLEDDDVVEVYSSEHMRLYISEKILDFCSYSLSDLLTKPVWELYERDPAINEQLIEWVEFIMSGETLDIKRLPLEPHIVKEKLGTLSAKLFPRFISPVLTSENEVIGWATIIKVRPT